MKVRDLVLAEDMVTPQCPSADNFLAQLKNEISIRMSNFQRTEHIVSNQRLELINFSIHRILSSFFEQGGKDADAFIMFVEQIMPTSACKDVSIRIEAQSESKLWLELRYGRITASKIYEVSRCKPTTEVWCNK